MTQTNSQPPSAFNYSIIGIPEVLQFTVRLLEGEPHTHKHTHVPTRSLSHLDSDTLTPCQLHAHTYSLAFLPTHSLAHTQKECISLSRGFRFRVRVNFAASLLWSRCLAVRAIASYWFLWSPNCNREPQGDVNMCGFFFTSVWNIWSQYVELVLMHVKTVVFLFVMMTLHLSPSLPRMLPFCMAWEWSTSTIMPFSGEYLLFDLHKNNRQLPAPPEAWSS